MGLPFMIKRTGVLAFFVLNAAAFGHAAETNLVANGSFEQSAIKGGVPDEWSSAGNRAIHQQLTLDTGRDGKRCAKLACTEFTGDGPDTHAMLCQTGKIAFATASGIASPFGRRAAGSREARSRWP